MADSQDSRIKVDRTQGEGTSVLLDIKNLRTTFGTISGDVQAVRGIFEKKRFLKAVDGVSFSIETGTTMGLVGESGCGKTTLGRALLRLYDIEEGGKIFFDGTDISHLNDQQMRPYRKRMQMIFQDPYTSLDPRKTVGATIGELLEALDIMQGKAAQVDELYEHMLHPYTQCLKICEQKKPELKKINKEHYVACHLYGEALSE